MRMINAASARVVKRSRSLPSEMATRRVRIMMVALTVDMPKPATKVYSSMGTTDMSADMVNILYLRRRGGNAFRIILIIRVDIKAIIPTCSPDMARI